MCLTPSKPPPNVSTIHLLHTGTGYLQKLYIFHLSSARGFIFSPNSCEDMPKDVVRVPFINNCGATISSRQRGRECESCVLVFWICIDTPRTPHTNAAKLAICLFWSISFLRGHAECRLELKIILPHHGDCTDAWCHRIQLWLIISHTHANRLRLPQSVWATHVLQCKSTSMNKTSSTALPFVRSHYFHIFIILLIQSHSLPNTEALKELWMENAWQFGCAAATTRTEDSVLPQNTFVAGQPFSHSLTHSFAATSLWWWYAIFERAASHSPSIQLLTFLSKSILYCMPQRRWRDRRRSLFSFFFHPFAVCAVCKGKSTFAKYTTSSLTFPTDRLECMIKNRFPF